MGENQNKAAAQIANMIIERMPGATVPQLLNAVDAFGPIIKHTMEYGQMSQQQLDEAIVATYASLSSENRARFIDYGKQLLRKHSEQK